MERVKKEDLALNCGKNSNVATIKGTLGRLNMMTLSIALCGIALLLISIPNLVNQYHDKGVYDNWSLLIISAVLLAAAAVIPTVEAIIFKNPNIYFVGNDMYIKENKDYYLKVAPQEIDECGWTPSISQNYAGLRNNLGRYASCSYWGNVNIVVNGITYSLSCSSLKKAKHYFDGFINGLTVEENTFDGDPLKSLYIRICVATSVVTCMMIAFCYMMFETYNNVISTIAIIMFAGSILTGIILLIRFAGKSKNIKRLEQQYFNDFVVNQPIKFKKSDDSTQDSAWTKQDF